MLIIKGNANEVTFNTDVFHQGLYCLRIEDNNETVSSSVVQQ